MEQRLSKIYYSPRGYWRGFTAITKLSSAAKVLEDTVKQWLMKQAIWQIYLPAPRRIPGPIFDVNAHQDVPQADLLYLPHDKVGRNAFKYALTISDIASRFKEAEPLSTKADEVAADFERVYKRGPLRWPKLLQVDPGKEFMGPVNKLLAKHQVSIRRGRVNLHRDQAIVERLNRTLTERLFGHQYAQEMRLPKDQQSRVWVKRLPEVVYALNNEVTQSTGMKPVVAIRLSKVTHKLPYVSRGRVVGFDERKIPPGVGLRCLAVVSLILIEIKLVQWKTPFLLFYMYKIYLNVSATRAIFSDKLYKLVV